MTVLAFDGDPLEDPGAAYSLLRQEGIRRLEGLGGRLWTEFNVHDPGITILEQLCYALTDFAYRTQYEFPDLLTSGGEEPYASLFTPAQILPTSPVTLADVRKLVIDVPGVKNAWIEVAENPSASYDEVRAEVSYLAPGGGGAGAPNVSPNVSEIRPRGLCRVRIEKSELVDIGGEEIRREAARRLHRVRGLGQDYVAVEILECQDVQIAATLEVGPVGDATELLASVYRRMAAYCSPSGRFHTLAEMLGRGRRMDEIFEGPLLDHGFIDSEEPAGIVRRTSVRISDLIHELAAVPGVVAVKEVHFLVGDQPSKDWLLSLDPRRTPRFDLRNSSIRLERRGLRVVASQELKSAAIARAQQAASPTTSAAADRDLRPRPGRDRQIDSYHSVQQQFPMVYGIGTAGLSRSASPERKAQAKQLKAYLMFYDQLLGNCFAQLANVGKLFSFHDGSADSYFSRAVQDDGDGTLGLDEIRTSGPEHERVLQQITEDPWSPPGPVSDQPGVPRRNRFLDHLLARFGEQFGDHSLLQAGAGATDGMTPEKRVEQVLRDKRAFLRDYPRIGRDRGAGFKCLAPADNDNVSGLELTLRRKLGVDDDGEERFHLVEHILLRPVAGDANQHGPLFRAANVRDPYSLQISLVFPSWPTRCQDRNFRQLVEETVREHTPAHLTAYVRWFDKDDMTRFEAAYAAWLHHLRNHRLAELGLLHMDVPIHDVPLRSARDRLIDLLGIGDSYPLTDLKVVADRLKVAFGSTAKIPIENAQANVTYELCDPKGEPLGDKFTADGNDATLVIETPEVTEDVTYRIRATKKPAGAALPRQMPRFLDETAPVKVGLDTALVIEILRAPLLDRANANPQPADPRIVPFGASVDVQVNDSQEGVQYSLILNEQDVSGVVRTGNLDAVTLSTGPVHEDTVIEVRATKGSEATPLDAKLYLKVMANPAPAISVDVSPILDYGQGATIRIESTQPRARYRAYLRTIPDADFVRRDPAGADIATVPVSGQPDVRVRKPPRSWALGAPDGYAPLGDPVPGNGSAITMGVPGLAEDSIVIVQALKDHPIDAHDPASKTITSAVLLDQAAVLLVRPDPARVLTLRVHVAGAQTGGAMEVSGGQPGVFYHFRPSSGGAEFSLPAYFHKRDPQDETQNKGLGQLGVEVDCVVAADPAVRPAAGTNPATAFPRPPVLEIAPLGTGVSLSIRAVKAQTRVETDMARVAHVAAVPAIHADPHPVAFGASTTIVIEASAPADQYRLVLAGAPVKPPVAGSNADLRVVTDPLHATVPFEVVITRPGDDGMTVERVVHGVIHVLPPPPPPPPEPGA